MTRKKPVPRLIVPKSNDIENWHYEYRAKCVRVIDGDTVTVFVELGFYAIQQIDLRIRDIDTPEMRKGDSVTRALGKDAQYYTGRWLSRAQPKGVKWPLMIRTATDEVEALTTHWEPTFTRWVGDIINMRGHSLAHSLLDNGHAEYRPDMG